jgi:phosphate transport system permease protein
MKIRPFRLSLLGLSLLIPAALCAVILFLMIYSAPAIGFNGLGFVTGITWNLGDLYGDPVVTRGFMVPNGADYGILVFVVGTLVTSFLALLIPLIGHYVSPTGNGYGLLSASIVLALMITPIIATTLLDALIQVPKENRESAFGLGATHFEVVSKAMMPMVRTTLIGGVVLALGRALGETMAIAMVSGGALNILPTSLFSPVSTIASFILTQLDSAESDPTNMAVRSLAEIALALFVITLAMNAGAKLLTSGALHVRKRQS